MIIKGKLSMNMKRKSKESTSSWVHRQLQGMQVRIHIEQSNKCKWCKECL